MVVVPPELIDVVPPVLDDVPPEPAVAPPEPPELDDPLVSCPPHAARRPIPVHAIAIRTHMAKTIREPPRADNDFP